MPASIETQPLILEEPIALDQVREVCRDQPGRLFAILDSCDEPRVPSKVSELPPERAKSLYSGWAEQDYWAIAPYLVQVDEQLLDWIVENLWEAPWGIFVIADAGFPTLRKHFRRFLIVTDPEGRKMHFRFYDPRVLPTFLKTCNADEVQALFGPVEKFVCGDRALSRKGIS